MKIQMCVIFFSICFVGCNKSEEHSLKTNNINCPDFYPKIENVYWAEHDFNIPSDSLHQYWYRLMTFSEEEGFCIIVEKLRQGIAEGMGGLQVVEQKNITHIKGIEDANGISVHYKIKKWISPKEVILVIDEQREPKGNYSFKIVNLEMLSVRDTTSQE